MCLNYLLLLSPLLSLTEMRDTCPCVTTRQVNLPLIVAGLIILSLHWQDAEPCDNDHREKWRWWALISVVRMVLITPVVLVSRDSYRGTRCMQHTCFVFFTGQATLSRLCLVFVAKWYQTIGTSAVADADATLMGAWMMLRCAESCWTDTAGAT